MNIAIGRTCPILFRTTGGISIGEFEVFRPYRHLVAAVSTRDGGVSSAPFASLNVGLHVGDRPEDVLENRRRLCHALSMRVEHLVVPQQVHGTTVVQVSGAERGYGALRHAEAIPEADGLVTDTPDIPLIAFSSDCPIILLYDSARPAIGLVHAGWRGTVGRIAQQGVRLMQDAFGTRAQDLLACIAPSVGPCCYQVQDDVVSAARSAALPVERLLVRRVDSMYFDLWEANRLQLLEAGVGPENIVVSGLCTACHVDKFFSLRRERSSTGRFGVIMMLRANNSNSCVVPSH